MLSKGSDQILISATSESPQPMVTEQALGSFLSPLKSRLSLSLHPYGRQELLGLSHLVLSIHFFPFTCYLQSVLAFIPFLFSNEAAKVTRSLLWLLQKFACEYSHSHALSPFTADGSSRFSSIHMCIGDYQQRAVHNHSNHIHTFTRYGLWCPFSAKCTPRLMHMPSSFSHLLEASRSKHTTVLKGEVSEPEVGEERAAT